MLAGIDNRVPCKCHNKGIGHSVGMQWVSTIEHVCVTVCVCIHLLTQHYTSYCIPIECPVHISKLLSEFISAVSFYIGMHVLTIITISSECLHHPIQLEVGCCCCG